MSIGWVKVTRKAAPGQTIVTLPKGQWIEVARIDEGEVLESLLGKVEVGPAFMSASLYGKPPTVKPTVAEARWMRRPDGNPEDPDESKRPDPTQHTGLVMNPESTWEASVTGPPEFLTHDDFPLALQVKQNGSTWGLHTVIAVIHAPTLYAAARMLIIR